jgi:hypothetical protein
MAIKTQIAALMSIMYTVRWRAAIAFLILAYCISGWMFRHSIAFWEPSEIIGTGIVFIAGCIELRVHVLKKPKDDKARERMGVIGTILLFVGLALEFVGGAATIGLADVEIAGITQQSEELAKESEQLKLQTAQLTKENQDLKIKAGQMADDLRRFEYEQFARGAPRMFSPEMEKLKACGWQSVDVILTSTDAEPHLLAKEIALSCGDLKWDVRQWRVKSEYLGEYMQFPTVGTRQGSSPQTVAAAQEIYDALIRSEFEWARIVEKNVPIPTLKLSWQFGRDGKLLDPLFGTPFGVDPVSPSQLAWHDRKAAQIRIMIGDKFTALFW